MNVKDKIVYALALRWARGKVKDLRGKERDTAMGKFLKFVDGWKTVIGFVILLGAGVYDASTGHQSSGFVSAIFSLLQWNLAAIDPEAFAAAVGGIVSIIGVIHKLVKAKRQSDSGVPAAELLSTGGYVTQFVEEGRVPVVGAQPPSK